MAGLISKPRSNNKSRKPDSSLKEQVTIFFGNVKNYFEEVPHYNLLSKESPSHELHYNFIKTTILDLYKNLKFDNIEYNVFIELLNQTGGKDNALHRMIDFILDNSGIKNKIKLKRELENIIPGYGAKLGKPYNFNLNALGDSNLQSGGFKLESIFTLIGLICVIFFTSKNISSVNTFFKATINAARVFSNSIKNGNYPSNGVPSNFATMIQDQAGEIERRGQLLERQQQQLERQQQQLQAVKRTTNVEECEIDGALNTMCLQNAMLANLLKNHQQRIFKFDDVTAPKIRDTVKNTRSYMLAENTLKELLEECNKSWGKFFGVSSCRQLSDAITYKDDTFMNLVKKYNRAYELTIASNLPNALPLKQAENIAIANARNKLKDELNQEKNGIMGNSSRKPQNNKLNRSRDPQLNGPSKRRIGYGGNNRTRKIRKYHKRTRKN